jgi:hypothetical protein
MGHEGRRGGGGQDQSSAALAFSFFFGVRRLDAALPSSLVKNRTAEGRTLSKTKDERRGTRESPSGSIYAPPSFSLFFGVRRLDAALPSSLVKNRTAEGPTLSKTKDERVGHPRIVSRVDLYSTRQVGADIRVL